MLGSLENEAGVERSVLSVIEHPLSVVESVLVSHAN